MNNNTPYWIRSFSFFFSISLCCLSFSSLFSCFFLVLLVVFIKFLFYLLICATNFFFLLHTFPLFRLIFHCSNFSEFIQLIFPLLRAHTIIFLCYFLINNGMLFDFNVSFITCAVFQILELVVFTFVLIWLL